ncbi:hypothetical protein [Microcoleus sp. CAWBG58]|uniref:hypothetical protein n=1 Tax=Microcoleus sp. CAWBG58 TaxID=2841651 RepID=UPI0025E11BEB|nr:hypothetical protein [Microcoleus sp. CAWBG58]
MLVLPVFDNKSCLLSIDNPYRTHLRSFNDRLMAGDRPIALDRPKIPTCELRENFSELKPTTVKQS